MWRVRALGSPPPASTSRFDAWSMTYLILQLQLCRKLSFLDDWIPGQVVFTSLLGAMP